LGTGEDGVLQEGLTRSIMANQMSTTTTEEGKRERPLADCRESQSNNVAKKLRMGTKIKDLRYARAFAESAWR